MSPRRVLKSVNLDTSKIAIIATVGPAVFDPKAKPLDNRRRLEELVDKGASAFRINFSHVVPDNPKRDKYSYQDAKDLIDSIRAIEEDKGTPIPIIMDLKGPEIRTEKLFDPKKLRKDDALTVGQNTQDRVYIGQVCKTILPKEAEKRVLVSYEGDLIAELRRGHRIRIDDGRIELRATAVDRQNAYVKCTVETEGQIKLGKSLNLPDRKHHTIKRMIDKGRDDIRQLFPVDFVAQSFVRSASDVVRLSEALQRYQDHGLPIPEIIAKIETKDAAKPSVFRDIVEHERTFGAMVARGDLGGELKLGTAGVPAAQLDLIRIANQVGKPVIVATQMLESMTEAPVPTRAEAQDVWSAVRQGADAVMLSGETAKGKYAVKAVEKMKEIVAQVRLDIKHYRQRFERDDGRGHRARRKPPESAVEALGYPIVALAEECGSPFIVTYATKGWCAARIARFRPKGSIRTIALTVRPQKARCLRLIYGVYPALLKCGEELGREEDGDLPRDRAEVIELCQSVIEEMVATSFANPKESLGKDWRERFIVATLADTKPEQDWDVARVLLVFKTQE